MRGSLLPSASESAGRLAGPVGWPAEWLEVYEALVGLLLECREVEVWETAVWLDMPVMVLVRCVELLEVVETTVPLDVDGAPVTVGPK